MHSTKNTVEAEHHMKNLARKGVLELEERFVNSAAFHCNNMHVRDDPGLQVTSVLNLLLSQHLSDPVILFRDNTIQQVEHIDTEKHDSE